MEVTKVFTGVVTRVNPDANHLQIFFAPMNEERKNVVRGADGRPVMWAVEMAGSAQAAQDGISVSTFPPGTIFSVALHPARDGQHAGTRGRTAARSSSAPRRSRRRRASIATPCARQHASSATRAPTPAAPPGTKE